jgi:hypothetical protein
MLTPVVSDCVLYLSSDQMARGRFLQLPALHCGRFQNSSLVVGAGVEMLIPIAAAKIPRGIEAWKWTCFDFASTNITPRIPIASLAIARARAASVGAWTLEGRERHWCFPLT